MIDSEGVATSKKNLTTSRTVWFAALVAATIFTLIFSSFGTSNKADEFLHSADDLVRMVIVRDWLDGQSWFDPILHRLGFAPGTHMHWSRLIDAPIGMLVLIGDLISAGSGERFAAVAWPFVVFVFAIAGLLTAVRRATGYDNAGPSLIIGGVALWSWGLFKPGVIDHHNVQTTLAVWLIASVLPSDNSKRSLLLAGVITALMLAIGMESLPIAIAGALAILVRLICERESVVESVRGYGLSLATTIAFLFVTLTSPEYFAQSNCDSLSLFHLVCAGSGGLIVYAALHPSIRDRIPVPYFTAPVFAGGIVLAIAIVLFPHCLANPVGSIDPILQHYWLDSIQEAQNFLDVAKLDPWLLVFDYALAVLALGALVWQLIKGERLIAIQLLIFLLTSTAVALFQMRGVQQSGPIAGLVLSIAATRFVSLKGKTHPAACLAVLILCCNLFWESAVIGIMTALSVEPGPLIAASSNQKANLCRNEADLDILTAEPPGFIASPNSMGPWLLLMTKHHVLAGPYHRNGSGNLAAVNISIGAEEHAKKVMMASGITLFVSCPDFSSEKQILREAPNGFLALLLSGKKMNWLEPIQFSTDKPLKVWKVIKP